MFDKNFEFIKKIKNSYEKYALDKYKKGSLKELAKFFNIDIDEERKQDLEVIDINFNVPSIKILDKKNNITYDAFYTGCADLLNYSSGKTKFNKLLINSEAYKIESLYHIGDESPIIERMTLSDNDYDLVFEREMPNNISFFEQDGVEFSISYIQRLNYNGEKVKQNLFTKIYKEKDNGKGLESFQQFYTYDSNYPYIKRNDSQNNYTYIKNNSVIYGINEDFKKDEHCNLKGCCFENTDLYLDDYFPYMMKASSFPKLCDNKTVSGIVFYGFTCNYKHLMEIYKDNSKITIEYEKIPIDVNLEHDKKQFFFPVLSRGKISTTEIKLTMKELKNKLDGEFVNLVLKELDAFANMIYKRRGLLTVNDKLSPKLFVNKSFKEIGEMVYKNKEEYFSLALQQFENATNISRKEKTKVLKINKQ